MLCDKPLPHLAPAVPERYQYQYRHQHRHHHEHRPPHLCEAIADTGRFGSRAERHERGGERKPSHPLWGGRDVRRREHFHQPPVERTGIRVQPRCRLTAGAVHRGQTKSAAATTTPTTTPTRKVWSGCCRCCPGLDRAGGSVRRGPFPVCPGAGLPERTRLRRLSSPGARTPRPGRRPLLPGSVVPQNRDRRRPGSDPTDVDDGRRGCRHGRCANNDRGERQCGTLRFACASRHY
mmetsp:Transcript_8558/g.25345  ORF Transcript_8558/g.25345 Transcript_8558/m.25345 type:complete len:235 (+) Transcript_8558:2817-3521(+)